MDDQQWQQYTQGLAQQEIDRRAVQSTREEVKDLIRQTTTCDGTIGYGTYGLVRIV